MRNIKNTSGSFTRIAIDFYKHNRKQKPKQENTYFTFHAVMVTENG